MCCWLWQKFKLMDKGSKMVNITECRWKIRSKARYIKNIISIQIVVIISLGFIISTREMKPPDLNQIVKFNMIWFNDRKKNSSSLQPHSYTTYTYKNIDFVIRDFFLSSFVLLIQKTKLYKANIISSFGSFYVVFIFIIIMKVCC